MNTNTLEQDVNLVCALIETRAQAGIRSIIGIAGPPASGKSTLAEAVVQQLNQESDSPVPRATLLPMDGYHLDNRILEARGLLPRKGAPETFDAYGFCAAVKLLAVTRREIYLPEFDRQLDLAIANSIVIHPETPVIVVEGNYLLLKTEPWSSLLDVFMATVFVSPSIESLRERLQQRWIDHGHDPQAAMLRATENDLVNAELILRDSGKADLTLTQT
ncbi:MAG: uridine kinase [Gammaproteobacteria bacterium]|nr:uridine kinase [Gammaproteobacteria bacterium]